LDCRLIVIAGNIFNGQWRDYRTGLFFADRSGIYGRPVFA
jgi:DNA repair protein SbcD/Mre11